jgi:hypothetical protein
MHAEIRLNLAARKISYVKRQRQGKKQSNPDQAGLRQGCT